MSKSWLILGAMFLVIIMITNVRFNPTIYAECGGTHIAYESGYITLNRINRNGHPWRSVYRAPKDLLSSSTTWNNDKSTCEGTGTYGDYYHNPLNVFKWDKGAGKATYYYSGDRASYSGRTTECKILPVDSAPDWVQFRTSGVLNDSC
tara:strand:- start:68 stop:511 length:444 start_codon:yes stop_codon:yes gene_type:complete